MMRLMLALAAAAVADPGPYCTQLENNYIETNPDVRVPSKTWISTYGRRNNLTMLWGLGPPSRAAAALGAVLLRAGHRLRYNGIHVARGPDDVCGLAAKYTTTYGGINTGFVAHMSAAWNPDKRCKAVEECDDTFRGRYQECGLAGGQLQPLGPGAAPAQLRLLARLAPALRDDPACADIRDWEFYYNETAVRHCGFLHPNNITQYDTEVANNTNLWPRRMECPPATPCVAVLAPSEAREVAAELTARAKAAGLALVTLPLEPGAKPRFRYFQLLHETNHSVLLLDYDLGSPTLDFVQPPPCLPLQSCSPELDPGISLSFIDYNGLRYFAPRINETLQKFNPKPYDIQNILEEEVKTNNTEEAACKWALENSIRFESWFPLASNDEYKAIVFICKGDGNRKTYETIVNFTIQYTLQNNRIKPYLTTASVSEIDCGDTNNLNTEIKNLMSQHTLTRLAGVIVLGEGVAAGMDAANERKLALVSYDTTSVVRPENMTFVTTGSIHDLAVSVRQFLVNWTRIAVLSEDTAFAKKFYKAICDETTITCKNAFVSPGTINETLSSLRQLDARIFIVNARADIAASIICDALRLKLTTPTKYVWILRDWQPTELKCIKSQTMSISHFTITFSWRGGDDNVLADGLTSLRRALATKLRDTASTSISGDEWPPLGTSLVDALLTLSNIFNNFLYDHLELRDNIHGYYVASIFEKMFRNYNVTGVTQELRIKNFMLQNPLVFVERWENGTARTLLGVWKVIDYDVKVLKYLQPIFEGDIPDDGTIYCITKTTGNSFAPTCLDPAWIAVTFILILALITVYLFRRARLRKLKERDLQLQREQRERKHRAVSQLAGYIVDSDDLELHEVLGSGRFGTVRLGILKTDERPRAIAVKAIAESAAPSEERKFLHEAVLLASLEHRNIIRFQGICVTEEALLVLIEHAFFGDLQRYLSTRRHLIQNARESTIEEDTVNEELAHISSVELTRLAREAASALGYLAYKRVIHCDVRAVNCLVNERRTLKLADFGLAVELDVNCENEEYICPSAVRPAAWTAPESLTLGKFTLASDIWSLGVLMLEIVTLGEHPYGSWSTQEVVRYVTEGGCPPLPQDARPQMRGLAMSCWRARPAERPTAAAVVDYLAQNPDALAPALLLTTPDPRPSSTDSGYSDYT